jgi:hypothetical protein
MSFAGSNFQNSNSCASLIILRLDPQTGLLIWGPLISSFSLTYFTVMLVPPQLNASVMCKRPESKLCIRRPLNGCHLRLTIRLLSITLQDVYTQY